MKWRHIITVIVVVLVLLLVIGTVVAFTGSSDDPKPTSTVSRR